MERAVVRERYPNNPKKFFWSCYMAMVKTSGLLEGYTRHSRFHADVSSISQRLELRNPGDCLLLLRLQLQSGKFELCNGVHWEGSGVIFG